MGSLRHLHVIKIRMPSLISFKRNPNPEHFFGTWSDNQHLCTYMYWMYVCIERERGRKKGPATSCWHCLHQRPYEQWRTYEDHQEGNKEQRCNLWHSDASTICRRHMVNFLNPFFWPNEKLWSFNQSTMKLRYEQDQKTKSRIKYKRCSLEKN